MENPKGYACPDLLIDPAELAGRLGVAGGTPAEWSPETTAPATVVIDLRPTEAFAAGHIPGAAHLDLFGVSLVDTDPAPLDAFLWIIAHLLAARGVDAERPVVVYDERSGIRAARAFWFLELFGHPAARLLDGGFGAWERGGQPVTTAAAPPVAGRWQPGREAARLATWRDVQDLLGRADVAILDTRSDGEYCGANVRAKRGGAIPGAVHIEWTRNLGADGGVQAGGRAARDVRRRRASHPTGRSLSYCQGGYRAAHSYLALRLLGYPRVRNYLGSWKEWGDREDLPIEMPGA